MANEAEAYGLFTFCYFFAVQMFSPLRYSFSAFPSFVTLHYMLINSGQRLSKLAMMLHV